MDKLASKTRFPKEILYNRLKRFQEKLKEKNIDAAMIRTLSSYAYFTGIKWLRPALLIPAEGEPVVFVANGEEEGFMEKSWLDNIVTFREGGDLMRKVSGLIRDKGYRVVGLEYGVERDAYILFYEMFKRLNPQVEIVDVSPILDDMKMIKDKYELEAIKAAGEKARRVFNGIDEIVKPGLSETEIAGEIYRMLYSLGSEQPQVYVNAGPYPRIHGEPFHDNRVLENTFVTIVVGADHNGYYVNKSTSIYIGEPNSKAKKIIECMEKAYDKARELTRPGVRFIDVMKELDKIYEAYGLKEYRVEGYAHGVGLKIEETPITTIVPKHRFIVVKENMVLAYIHAPIVVNGLGQVKFEDTFIITREGGVKIT